MYAPMRSMRRGRDVVRSPVARNPPIELAGVPREQPPSVALLHVADPLVDRPLHRDLNDPGVRLIGGQDLVKLLVDPHPLVEVELAAPVLDQLVRNGIDV